MDMTTFAVLPLSANAVLREGFDLIEVTWKLSAKQKEAGITKEMRAPKMVYVPSMEMQCAAFLKMGENTDVRWSALPNDWRAVFLNAVSSQRDAIVKALIENGSNVIPEDSVSLEVCVASMLAEKETERLNGERIEAWFNNSEEMQAFLKGVAETKSAETGKAFALCFAERKNIYLTTIKKLAAPNPGISESDRNKLVATLQGLNDQSSLCAALIRKAQNIEYVSGL